MIPINIKIDDYYVGNISSNDLQNILFCTNQDEESFKSLGRNTEFTLEDIKQRYLETLVSTLDFFCGIYHREKLIGILKGRIENKNKKELWILSYILIKEYRNNEIGTKILREFESYFSYHFSIDNIYVLITERNAGGQKFWVKNEYEIKRIISNIMENEDANMLVYGKEK